MPYCCFDVAIVSTARLVLRECGSVSPRPTFPRSAKNRGSFSVGDDQSVEVGCLCKREKDTEVPRLDNLLLVRICHDWASAVPERRTSVCWRPMAISPPGILDC